MASAERWIGSRQRWSGMRARPSQARQKRVVASRRRLASSTSAGAARPSAHDSAQYSCSPSRGRAGPGPGCPRPRAPCRCAAGPSGPRRWPRRVTVAVHQRPVGRGPAVVEHRLADQLHLDLPSRQRDRAHQQVVGVVVGRGPGVGGDLVLALPRAHGERVADHDPAGRRLPGRDQHVGPGLVASRRRDVDAERTQAESARLAVEQGPEHARGVEPWDAQPVDPPVGATSAPVWQSEGTRSPRSGRTATASPRSGLSPPPRRTAALDPLEPVRFLLCGDHYGSHGSGASSRGRLA